MSHSRDDIQYETKESAIKPLHKSVACSETQRPRRWMPLL